MSLIPEQWELLDRGTDYAAISRKRGTGATVWRLAYQPGVRGGAADWRVTGILLPNMEFRTFSGFRLSDSEIDTKLRNFAEGVI